MARTALTAPAHRVQQRNATGNLNQQPDSAPSLDFGGSGLQDSRLPYDKFNSTTGAQVLGWAGNDACVVDQVPAAASTTSVAAAANVVSGTPMTLVSASGAGIVALSSSFTALPSLSVMAAGTLAVQSLPGYLRFGIRDVTALHDPTQALTRALSITGIVGGTGGAFLVSGFDLYGFAQTETITAAAGAATTNGKKTWKFIRSVTPQFTDAHNYSVGTADIFGLGLAADFFAYAYIVWNNASVTASTGFVVADATSPATATTGDVRGTYAVQTASDGTKRLQIFVSVSAARLNASLMSTGLFGVTPA